MAFSGMMIFLLLLILTLCGVRVSAWTNEIQGPTWEASLWCDVPTTRTEDGPDGGCASGQRGNYSVKTQHSTTNVTGCHVTSYSHLPLLTKDTHDARATRLNILCRIDETASNLICNLEWPSNLRGTGVLSVNSQDSPSGMGAACEARRREGSDSVTCVLALGALDGQVTLTVSVSSCTGPVQSPAMRFVPRTLLTLVPPGNLHHTMTAEGEVHLGWTTPRPESSQLSCHIRCAQESSAHVFLVRDASRPEVELSGLSAGFNYSVQVRCRSLEEAGVWSAWSPPLYIYLREVTYLPERLFASTGSNVTVRCVFNNRSLRAEDVAWWLNYHEKIPESQYSVVSERVSSVTLLDVRPPRQRGYDVLHCCQKSGASSRCSYPYAQIYVTDFNIAISCETNGDLSSMTCRWNASQWAEVTFLYRKHNFPCDVAEQEVGVVPTEECPVEGRGSNRCTLQPLLLASCYRMWLEVRKEEGVIRSRPTSVMPMDLVRPHPPFELSAVTVPAGFLSVEWKRHELPVYGLQYEVRYAAEGTSTHWKVAGPVFNESAVVAVSDPCLVYTVQVRCWRSGGAGYWSDWSDPCNSTVQSFRAPEEGPDFWRVIQEDPELNRTNVTLLLKPLPRGNPLFCVERLEVRHQTTGGAMWSENPGWVSGYTFLWSAGEHAVTVMAVNELGSSTRNTHMALSRRPKTQPVRAFGSTVLNGSCAVLSWLLDPTVPAPVSFVVEWRGRGGAGERAVGESISWARVPATTSPFYLHDVFFESDEYQFVLYPVFEHGEGDPISSKGRSMSSTLSPLWDPISAPPQKNLCSARNGCVLLSTIINFFIPLADVRGRPGREQAVYTLMMVVAFLSVALFMMLTVSQRQMRRVVWKDVPNPSNCSWAQGVDFKKAEIIENLFRHPELLTSHPLLLESEAISEAVIVEETTPPAQEKISESPGHSAVEESREIQGLEGSAQSRITYATVLPPGALCLLYKQQESLSSISDEGNFSANVSDISGSFPGAAWEPEHPQGSQSLLRCSSLYNSAEEYSETSEREEEEAPDRSDTGRKLCYLRMTSQEEGEEDNGQEAEELGARFRQDDVLAALPGQWHRLPQESSPLLGTQGGEWAVGSAVSNVPLYMPQFRTLPLKPSSAAIHETSLQGSPTL
ncbi:leptin receptor isoform X2 [Brienomyrus brachyistius]|uniref:leptin receptor isoform X2 n=1 Tax=Brienomyrus brachyistius TaxID=42636 RepID=UPI0020B42E6F|nr:leptin receptor isoform X2 [Brienomyrus brachyistius]